MTTLLKGAWPSVERRPGICDTCRRQYATATWIATAENGDRWQVCDRCREQARNHRSPIVFMPADLHAPAIPDDAIIDTPRPAVSLRHPDTSKAMEAKALPRAGSKRRQIADLIRASGAGGLTDYDLERLTGRQHQSVSSSRNGLMKDGLVCDSGDRRINHHGNEAIVWIATALLNSMLGDD